jgi:acyl-CoA thioesterase
MTDRQTQLLAEKCAQILMKSDTATQALNIVLHNVNAGTATLSMRISKDMSNGHGTCHGGYIFTLADSAFAFACNTYNQRCVAHHCSITYLTPARYGDELVARATEVSRVGRNGIYDVVITKDENCVVAEFRGHSRTIKGSILPETGSGPDTASG